jgi:hypothetical protein
MKTDGLKNKEMNFEVYALRRKVIELIYEAKQTVPNLPRIEVRITEESDRVNGVARVGGKAIWIPSNSAGRTEDQLRRTVFHEICHAAFGADHVEGCPLMAPVYQDISKKTAHMLLKKYAR